MITDVRALVALRWATVRSDGLRAAFGLALVSMIVVMVVILATRRQLPDAALVTVVQLTPPTFLGFAALAVIAPLAMGSSTDLFPPDQLTPHPIHPASRFGASLLLAPMNLVWIIQFLTLFAFTCWLVQNERALPFGLVLTFLYIAAVTTFGQLLSWLVLGLRQSDSGRRLLRIILIVAGGLLAWAVNTGVAQEFVNNLPLSPIPTTLQLGQAGRYFTWTILVLALLATISVLQITGIHVCSWALRRPASVTERRVGTRRRRPGSGSLSEFVELNRASAWRAVPVRRGALVLALVPVLAAAGIGFPWRSLVPIVGVIAAGGGLLFGINVFSLDGPGATWLSSLPEAPRTWFMAKVVVVAETVALGAAVVIVAGAIRAPDSPSAVEVAATLGAAVTTTIVVTAICLSTSIRHPHRADLQSPRDSPAPPGAMLAHSARLTGTGLGVGALLTFSLSGGQWVLTIALATALSGFGVVSLRRSAREWDDPEVRARVVSTVAAG